jgi:hypothetical protein
MRHLRRVDFPLEFIPRSAELVDRLGRTKALALLERGVDAAVRPLGLATAGHGIGNGSLGVVVELDHRSGAPDLDRIVMRAMETAAGAALSEIGAAEPSPAAAASEPPPSARRLGLRVSD